MVYITDPAVRSKASALLEEFKSWKPGGISLDPIKYAISIKVNGRVFAYLSARRKYYVLATFNAEDVWTEYSIKDDTDLEQAMTIVRASMERRLK